MSGLETGWNPETPHDDTLLRRYVMGFTTWLEEAGRAAGHRVHADDDFVAVDEQSPEWFMNSATLRRPVPPERARAVSDALHSAFSGAGADFVVFSAWPVPALDGIAVDGYPPWMVRPPGGAAPPIPAELVIDEVRDTDALHDYEQVLVDGFPLEALQPVQRGVVLDPSMLTLDAWRLWVGRVDGAPVSVAAAGVSNGLVRIEWVATLPDARGRGYGAALTGVATRAEPSWPAALVATDAGRPIYERMGYLPVSRFVFMRGARG